MQIERTRVLNVPVDLLTMDAAVERVVELAKSRRDGGGRTRYVVAVNPEKVFAARESAEIADFIENSDLALPDGIGVVVAARLLSGKAVERTPGADVMQEVCRLSGESDVGIFLYGAKEEVNASAVERLRERFPDIRIVGRRNGFVKPEKMGELVDEINSSGADVLFLALGSPRQERWANEFGPRLNVGVCMGVGGTFDTIAGTVKRAPLGWQKARLEWLYRLIRQPSRLWRCRRLLYFAVFVLFSASTPRRRRVGGAANLDDGGSKQTKNRF